MSPIKTPPFTIWRTTQEGVTRARGESHTLTPVFDSPCYHLLEAISRTDVYIWGRIKTVPISVWLQYDRLQVEWPCECLLYVQYNWKKHKSNFLDVWYMHAFSPPHTYTHLHTYPALLLTAVRPLTPVFSKLLIRFSGIPHNPKPVLKKVVHNK